MREKTLDRLKGNYCKIVTKETYILNTETIIAIKPKTKKGFAE